MSEGFFDVLKGRHSVRAYLNKPVPDELIEKVINLALQSPSWGNNQPWEIAVVGGPALEGIKNAYMKAMGEGRQPNPEFSFPASWPDVNKKRYFENGQRMYQTLGIERNDDKAREEFTKKATGFFGAPQVIFLFLDEGLSQYALFDLGLFSQTLMLAAHNLGLGTCAMAMAAIYPDVVHQALGISHKKKLALGIAIGYPDEAAQINKHRSTRASMEEAVKWYRG